MIIKQSDIFNDVKIFTSDVYKDHRGFFTESFNEIIQKELNITFFQDNHSKSFKNVFRGIHYQWDKPMGKLVRVVKGSGYDVIIDLRSTSPTFGFLETFYLSENNFLQIWVPEGFGHGFLSLEDETHFCYKCSSYHNPLNEGVISPISLLPYLNLPVLDNEIILSDKDKTAQSFENYKLNPKF